MKKTVIILLSLGVLLITYLVVDVILTSLKQNTLSFNQDSTNVIDISDLAYYEQSDYYQYTKAYSKVFPNVENILLFGYDYKNSTEPVDVLSAYEGKNQVLLTPDEGKTTWEVFIDEAGFYNLKLFYYPYPGKSSAIERALYINGEIPFDGAKTLTFARIWGNKNDIIQDIFDNDIRPSQIEVPSCPTRFYRTMKL